MSKRREFCKTVAKYLKEEDFNDPSWEKGWGMRFG